MFLIRGAGFYNYSHETEKMSLHSHPICCQWVGHAFWSQWRLNFSKKVLKQPPASPGYIIYSNLLELEIGNGILSARWHQHIKEQTIGSISTPHWVNGTQWPTTRGFRGTRPRHNYSTKMEILGSSKCSSQGGQDSIIIHMKRRRYYCIATPFVVNWWDRHSGRNGN